MAALKSSLANNKRKAHLYWSLSPAFLIFFSDSVFPSVESASSSCSLSMNGRILAIILTFAITICSQSEYAQLCVQHASLWQPLCRSTVEVEGLLCWTVAFRIPSEECQARSRTSSSHVIRSIYGYRERPVLRLHTGPIRIGA